MRVLRNRAETRTHTFYDGEEPVDADGVVTVTVTKADGSALSGSPFTATHGTTGIYTYSLPAQANLNLLSELWTGLFSTASRTESEYVEIVGGFYVDLGSIRKSPNVGAAFKFESQDLVDGRAWFEDTFEEHTGVAWVPRYARERHSGGSCRLNLNHYPVRSVYSVRCYTSASTYTTFSAGELEDLDLGESGTIERLFLGYFPAGNRNIVIEYEHGFERPTEDIRRAALVGIREGLLTNKVGTRQFSVQTEQGIVREAVASADFPFGVPFVDSVANRYRKYRVPSVA